MISTEPTAGSPKIGTLLLTAADVRRYLSAEQCLAAVEAAFRGWVREGTAPAATTGIETVGGGFHIKAGVLNLGRSYFAAKTNGNFPRNPATNGLPTIQGLVVLCDATNGAVLAVVDSVEITARRTAAATALAARLLARPDAKVVAICGCGFQAAYQVEALRVVLPVEKVISVDSDPMRAAQFADQLATYGLDSAAGALEDAVAAEPDVWVTCTTSEDFFLFPQHVKEGAFVAGVGVDHERKRELAPELLERSHVVTDWREQCERIGDLHHARDSGIEPQSIRELAELVSGQQSGRRGEDAIYVFDSTGIGLQDVAACAAVFESAAAAQGNGGQVVSVQFAT